MYNYQMKNYDVKEVVMNRVPPEKMEKEFPSYVIGHSQECLDVFLDVLHNKNDVIVNEVIALIESIQISPKIKSYLQDRMIQFVPIPAQQQEAEAETCNFKEWSNLLAWEKDGPLNKTMYMLTCLRDMISSKPVANTRNLPKAQEQQILEERQARTELQINLI